MRKITTILSSLLILTNLNAQFCDNDVPTFTVDLSGTPNTTYISPNTNRDGFCCTTSETCVEFIITLHPDAVGVIFDIYSGAVPPGALFYQIGCGPETNVGESICLTDAGPHHLTFCKPGGNANEFIITSLSSPTVSDAITVNEGCNGQLEAYDFEESTITWNSVYPGFSGQYNGYLDCTSGCALVNVSATGNFPDYVDYEVCGSPTGGCTSVVICDTVRTYFNSTLAVDVEADPPIICYDYNGTTLTANPSGGTGTYQYLWSTGETTQSIFVTAGGTYSVDLSDDSGCPGVTATIDVVEITNEPIVNAGVDQDMCVDFLPIQLNGSFSNLDGITWSGGQGMFSNSNALNPTYSPTQSEINNGAVTLTIEGYYNNGCPSVYDNVTINLIQYEASVTLTPNDVLCNGENTGSVSITILGNNAPYSINWIDFGINDVNTVNDIGAGTYSVEVTNNVGCSETYTFEINEPELLEMTLEKKEDITCFGLNNGIIEVSAEGGTGNYSYTVNGNPTTQNISGLSENVYTIVVTDENGCEDSFSVIIDEPEEMQMDLQKRDVSCYNKADGQVEVQVNGGVGKYTSPNMVYDANGYGIAANLAAGYYEYYAEDANGCPVEDNTTIIQPDPLTVSIMSTDTVCPTTDIVLSANASGGTFPFNYNWSNSPTNSATVSVTADTTTQFSVEVTDDNGCRTIDYSEYYVPLLSPNDLSLSSTNEVCFGEAVQINAFYSGDNYPLTVNWNTDFDGFGSFYDYPSQSKEYIIELTDKCDNTITKSTSVLVRQLPQIHLPELVAEGCPPLEVDFSSIIEAQDSVNYKWQFSDGSTSFENGPIITFYEEGEFDITLEVEDKYGCSNDVKAESAITVYPAPNASAKTPTYVVDEYNPLVQFYNESIGYTDFTWSFGDNTYSKEEHPVHKFREPGKYMVELSVVNDYKCFDKKSIEIEVKAVANVFIPNAFTPNGDGLNDIFNVEGYNLTDENFQMLIFNRWGDQIFQSNSLNNGWNGIYKNDIVPQGTYVYKVHVKDINGSEQEFIGSVAVLK